MYPTSAEMMQQQQQQRKTKRGLQQLTDVQKMEAINKVQKGETKAAVAREFGVPESTLRGWCKKAKINVATTGRQYVHKALQMAYRDGAYSKGSVSDGSSPRASSDEPEEEECEAKAISEDRRRILEWLNCNHYPQLLMATYTQSNLDKVNQFATIADNKAKEHATSKSQQFLNTAKGFYNNWCKNSQSCDLSPTSSASSEKNDSFVDEPLALIVPSKRRILELDEALNHQPNERQRTVSVEEALKHGEMFLNWLRECSHPNVTVVQAIQISTLINNIRSSLDQAKR